MTSKPRGENEMRWAPKLKGVVRHSGGSLSGSAQAASMAMGQIKEIEIRKQIGVQIDDEYLEKVSKTLNSKSQKRAPTTATRGPSGLGRILSIVVGVVVLVGGLVYGAAWMRSGPAHSVTGTLLLTRTPIVGAAVVFHPTKSGGKPARTTTKEDGSFRIGGLTPDAYKVTIEPGDFGSTAFPSAYSSAATTPLTLNVFRDRDMKQVRVNALTQPPQKKT